MTTAAIGGNQALNYPFQRAFVAAAAIGGVVYVASYDDINIAGVACWFPPEKELLSSYVPLLSTIKIVFILMGFISEEQQKAGFNDFMASLAPNVQQWWMEYVSCCCFLCNHSF
jgi:hypothetical protein